MKTRLKLFCALSCSIIQIFILCACNFNIGIFAIHDYLKYNWYCEELNITCLKETSFAVMEYKEQTYTIEYYEDLSRKIESTTAEDLGKIYPTLAGYFDYDGKFYLRYSEESVFLGEELNDYYWTSVTSQELLIGDIKHHKDYVAVTIEVDNLFDGKYIGKTISFVKV